MSEPSGGLPSPPASSAQTADTVNLACGALFILFALFFGYQSLGLELGTARNMGPGYFPLALAGLLFLFGAIILVQALRTSGEPVGGFAWRGILFILAAPIFFGITVRSLGFVPTLFFTGLIAAFASRRMTVGLALILALVLSVFCTLVFSYALELPFQRFGPWLPFRAPF
ncbi:tripartite tricarboxylate transporter TctB family protein [Mesorhizobium sp. RP14(2022)]|uniref:Tripartite tricarboxylate transporter TctB family protein n=1 Tax=Mesorhizobium liriopis TaxID=2953882 RepID=A0ABT1C1M3_9HYPH|nr:tripartite tricarboxylate transporter TctB family protein [Mesorhizobium liriopis]MCO6048719.1 tripartite tricarboxylate transporter TctB family protein [Mesorhizobium liriopis]